MIRLLIQCQGSPGPLSFKVNESMAATILKTYHNMSEREVIVIEDDITGHYHIDLSLVSWMCVIAEANDERGI